ncbi:hypothetical protein C8R44DRAFT_813167 [Mycena epipterygia]|nr:hypothetical protein C8R44DRAFT_813167 [Mycena epipterygia]
MWQENDQTMADLAAALSGSYSFPSLESLAMRGKYTVLETFIPLITSDCLKTVSLNLRDFQPLDSSLFSSLLASPMRLSTLRHFKLCTTDLATAETERHALFSMATFEPFYDCVNLETFDVNVDALKVEFHDADLEKMANAWPRLTHLRVFSRYTQQYGWADPDVHLYTLWHLVQKCPRLREIAMPINAKVDAPFVPPPESDPALCALRLRKLCFFLSPCAEGPHVATFIARAFPNVEEFIAGNPGEQPWVRLGWEHVRRTIRSRFRLSA